MTADQPNMINQENSIIVGQKRIIDDEKSMIDGGYSIIPE